MADIEKLEPKQEIEHAYSKLSFHCHNIYKYV